MVTADTDICHAARNYGVRAHGVTLSQKQVDYAMEKFRMWAFYLAGVSTGLADGSMHICQIVATKHSAKGASGLPLTRADLYMWPGLS